MLYRFPEDSALRVTKGIDAVYEPKAELQRIIREIAEEKGLPSNWINASAKPWAQVDMPGSQNRFEIIFATVTNSSQ